MIKVLLKNPIEKVDKEIGEFPGDGIQILVHNGWPPGLGWYRRGGPFPRRWGSACNCTCTQRRKVPYEQQVSSQHVLSGWAPDPLTIGPVAVSFLAAGHITFAHCVWDSIPCSRLVHSSLCSVPCDMYFVLCLALYSVQLFTPCLLMSMHRGSGYNTLPLHFAISLLS